MILFVHPGALWGHHVNQYRIQIIVCALFIGCAGSDTSEPEPNGPRLIGSDRAAVVLGETLFFTGRDLLQPDEGITRLNFVGQFVNQSGTRKQVDLTITPHHDGVEEDGLHVLRWSRVGPYVHPFSDSAGSEPGYFEGQVYAVSVPDEGTASVGEPTPFRLEIKPSIAIETWEPYVADCGAPALRGLGGLAYVMKVRAIGFEPVLFRYILGQTNGDEFTLIEHVANGRVDTVGTPDKLLILNEVAEGVSTYATSWSVEAEDAEGNVFENILPFSVHRPIDHYTDGKLREAEFFEPVPVSSCFKGSLGTDVVYSETVSETRQNAASITVSKNWMNARGQTRSNNWRDSVSVSSSDARSQTRQVALSEGETTTQTYGVSYNRAETNSFQTSTTDGETWTYSLNIGDSYARSDTEEIETSELTSSGWNVGAEASFPVQLFSVGGSGGYDRSTQRGTRERDSVTRTNTASTNSGYSSQSSRSQQTTFGSTTTDGQTSSMSGAFALNRAQTTTDSEGRVVTVSEARTLEVGATEGQSVTITEGESEAYQKTFTESTTNTTLTSYDGVVPRTKYGIFYRQSVRLVRTMYIRTFDLCGVSSLMGEIQFNEWTWAPDLALSEECPPFPESNLPTAQCLIEPCGEPLQ